MVANKTSVSYEISDECLHSLSVTINFDGEDKSIDIKNNNGNKNFVFIGTEISRTKCIAALILEACKIAESEEL